MAATELNRFEKARIIGARALQLASGAPPLIKIPKGMVSPVEVAFLEFEKDAIPLAVVRD
ncbi:MAG: DNA-directed RNA polymerase subunit K [Candidatus ainarchaeum sp.]|nr:DNA-directed RNA polymerase subunit K [Candidatus ainarchaeum sp.]